MGQENNVLCSPDLHPPGQAGLLHSSSAHFMYTCCIPRPRLGLFTGRRWGTRRFGGQRVVSSISQDQLQKLIWFCFLLLVNCKHHHSSILPPSTEHLLYAQACVLGEGLGPSLITSELTRLSPGMGNHHHNIEARFMSMSQFFPLSRPLFCFYFSK